MKLATTGEFRDPFGVATGPTAHVAPVYPALLAVMRRTLTSPAAFLWAVIVLNAMMLGTLVALMPAVSGEIFGRRGPGIAAGFMVLASSRLMPQWEVAFAALLLVAACLAGPVSAQALR